MKKGGIREVNSFIAVNSPTKKIIIPQSQKNNQTTGVAANTRSSAMRKNTSTIEQMDQVEESNKIKTNNHSLNARVSKVTESSRQATSKRVKIMDETEEWSLSTSTSTARSRLPRTSSLTKKIPASTTATSISSASKQNHQHVKPMKRKIMPSTLADEKRAFHSSKTTATSMNDVYASNATRRNKGQTTNKFESHNLDIPPAVNVDQRDSKEYEDDFEDYESDFDSYSESNKSDSQDESSELALASALMPVSNAVESENAVEQIAKRIALTQIHGDGYDTNRLELIKEAVQKENIQIQKSNSTFHHQQQRQQWKFEEQVAADCFTDTYNIKNLHKFSDAQKRQRTNEICQLLKSRGEKLLQMVSLDVMQYTLYEVTAIPYHIFMKCYARQNISQVYTQTNEEDTSSEVQTKEICASSKWTQYPVKFGKHIVDDQVNLREALLGVGVADDDDDNDNENENRERTESKISPRYDTTTRKLNYFMKTVGEEMIAFLEQEYAMTQNQTTKTEKFDGDDGDDSVSTITIKCQTIPHLRNRSIAMTVFDDRSQFRLLTVHRQLVHALISSCDDKGDYSSVLCIWSIHQPFTPKMILKSHAKVTTCCFAADDSSFVIAGHTDGSLCVWDIRESALHYEKIKIAENAQIEIRSPSYTTAANIFKDTSISHRSSVVKVDKLTPTYPTQQRPLDDFKIQNIFSMDEENFLIMWSLSRSCDKSANMVIGSAPWSKVKFFPNRVVDTSKYISKSYSFDLATFKISSNGKILVLGTNGGTISIFNLYHRVCESYYAYKDGRIAVTCLEVCPYDENYFAAGYSNGDVKLYNRQYREAISNLEKPHLPSVAVRSLQWLRSGQTSNFFVSLDLHWRFYVYRLYLQDFALVFVRSFKMRQDITTVILSSYDERVQSAASYLVYSTDKNSITIQRLNSFLTDKLQ